MPIKAIRTMDTLDALMATFDDQADWDDPWQVLTWCGLMVARQAAVGEQYKKRPDNTGLDQLNDQYKIASASNKEKAK